MEPINSNQSDYLDHPNELQTLGPQPNSIPPTYPNDSLGTTTTENGGNGSVLNSPTPEPKLSQKAEKLKKLSIQVMVGGLVGAAVVAVLAVLVGSFNETFAKALFTLLLVMVHSLACLAFVEQTGKSKNSSFKLFENAVFTIIVLSFFTSIFGVWGLLSGEIVGKLYLTYFVLLFACLHGQMLVDTRGKQRSIDTLVSINYALMGLVIALIIPIIWFNPDNFPSFYFRLLAACGIIDGTLTILAVILHRLYLQKHPEARSVIFSVATQVDSKGQLIPGQVVTQKRHTHPLIWLLGIFIVGQIIISLLFGIIGAFY